jgi:hypothetical protein
MTDKELAQIAYEYIYKGYNSEQLWDGDDLYKATGDEKERCVEFYGECRTIGTTAFLEKISKM